MIKIPSFDLTKRQKFVLVTLILVAGVLLIRLSPGLLLAWRGRVIIFSIVSLAVSLWALYDQDFSGVEWLTLPVLPSFFATSAALLYPLLPSRLESFLWITLSPDTSLLFGLLVKLVFFCLFIVGFYATLLTNNIFNVAAVRSIQLLRVAHSVGFLLTVATALFFYIVIASLHLNSFLVLISVFAITLPLSLQGLWNINLESTLTPAVRTGAILTSLIIAEIAWVLSFWPVSVSLFGLFLTAIFYELVGIIQYQLGEKLSPRVIQEFVFVAVAVFFLTVFVTQWGA